MEESPSPPLPTEVAVLHGMVRELLATVADLRKTIEAQQRRIDDLTRRLYGKKSERLTDDDPAPGVIPSSPAAPAPEARPRRRRGHGRRPLPDRLPRERVEYDLTEAESRCPCCGMPRVRIGAETSEQLDYRPASLFVIQRMAAASGDEPLVRMLLDRGADANAMGGVFPLVAAMNANDPGCVNLTLKAADRGALKDMGLFLVPPFGSPSALRDPKAVTAFFGAGADVAARGPAGRTILMLAVGSDDVPVETVQALIRLGADVNATTADGQTALDFARQLGRTPIVDLLVRSGAKPGRDAAAPGIKPKPAPFVRAAVERSLPLLQRADVTFLRKSGCISCYHNSMTAMTVASARKAGFPVDETIARSQRKEIAAYLEVWRERALQGMGIAGDSNSVNYLLAGLAADDHPADEATDAMARYLKNDQMPDGRWRLIANRPPLGSSDFELAAVAMRALQAYAPKTVRADYEKSVWRAADWLRTAKPKSTADRAFQLLGLTWAGDSKESLKKLATELLAEQRDDGGWAQLPTMASDAYATGQALAALHQSGAVAAADPGYRRGVKYLLSTQLEDGSWRVRSRSIPFQPYFESGFPHGRDQWISAAATNWAVMALIPAAE